MHTEMPLTASCHDFVQTSGRGNVEDKIKIVSEVRIILYFDQDFTGKYLGRKCTNLPAPILRKSRLC